MTSFLGRLFGTILFNKRVLKEVAESDDATSQAWLLLVFSSLLSTILQSMAAYQNPSATEYFQALKGMIGSIESIPSIIVFFVGFLVFIFIFTYFWAAVLSFVGRGFGGNLSTAECIRIIGFTSVLYLVPPAILTLISASVYPNLTPTLNLMRTIFIIWALVLFIYGYSLGSDLSILKSIIAVIVAAIFAVILAVIAVIILVFVLGLSLMAAFS